nr:hypothetical protein B0A51_09902 [Rachicladosporium sp. CCFEE 5018]
MTLLEIACFDLESVRLACEAGADRIELCHDRESGGTTPYLETVRTASDLCRKHGIPLFVMIRPRGGDFVYSLAEYSQMVADVTKYKPLVNGFVLGILTTDVDEDYVVNVVRTRNLVVLAAPLPCTFHRAFDEITHRMAALDDVVQAGCTSVLTSGGATTAVEGTNILHDLVSRAEGSLDIIAGGGLRSSNVIGIVATTGVKAVHSSAILDDSDLANTAEIAALKAAVGPT